MSFAPETIEQLKAPLDRAHVATREQAGRSLSYIEAWHAIAEANRIFGFDGWMRETVDLRQLGEPREVSGKYRVGYSAKVRITVFAGDRTIIREGCGFGSGIDKDVDQAHESALKEAESDAMKRALMTFGNPFGLALYDKTQASVASPAVMAASVAIGLCSTEAELSQWYEANKAMIDKMGGNDKADVRRIYGDRLKALRAAAPKTDDTPFDEAA